MYQRRDGVMGGVTCSVAILNGNGRRQRLLLYFFFFFFLRRHRRPGPAAVITQPNPLGGLSRLKSRKIVQLSGLLAGEGVGRVEWGGWGATLGLCAVGTRCVYTTQQLVAGLLWTHAADDKDEGETSKL